MTVCPFCREGRSHSHYWTRGQHTIERFLIARTPLDDEMDAWLKETNIRSRVVALLRQKGFVLAVRELDEAADEIEKMT